MDGKDGSGQYILCPGCTYYLAMVPNRCEPFSAPVQVKAGLWECGDGGALDTAPGAAVADLSACDTKCRAEKCSWFEFDPATKECIGKRDGCEETATVSVKYESYYPTGYRSKSCNYRGCQSYTVSGKEC